MKKPGRARYVGLNLTLEARAALHLAVLEWTSPAAGKLTMSDVVVEAVRVARKHPEELFTDRTPD